MNIFRRVDVTAIFCVLATLWAVACGKTSPNHAIVGVGAATAHVRGEGPRIILDFEEPDPSVFWELLPAVGAATTQAAATAPTTEPVSDPSHLTRSSLRPNTGLWSLEARLLPGNNGSLVHRFSTPADFQNFDTVSISVTHLGEPARSSDWTAAVVLVDESGKRIVGDAYPVTTRWTALPLDIKTAASEGIDLGHVATIGIEFRQAREGVTEPLEVQTDTWSVQRDYHAYMGQRLGAPKTFYAQRDGTRLAIGMVGQYEVTFYQRTGVERPWITITQTDANIANPERTMVLGQPGTGLMLLDQDMYDAIASGVRQDAIGTTRTDPGTPIPPFTPPALNPPTESWPRPVGGVSQWSWECVWTSPVAAIVEVKQDVGPFDRLGQPAAALKWRFMIYQWGQIFVHVEWTKGSPTVDDPISWALVLDQNAVRQKQDADLQSTAAGVERLLSEIYPASVRQGLTTALPHQMQMNAPIAMLAKTGSTNGGKNNWWWAEGRGRKIFGVGITQRKGPLDCMLLVNSPSPLMQAGSFAQYLVPPKVRVRQGELDRNFPGDLDNDGLVEPYGFQVIRLSNRRTSFMIYPQERPLFYPPYLFTVPAVERDAVDVKDSRVLINIDGKQFADPPAFPDGSFLLQIPYVLDRPVQVEAILVKK